MHEGPTIDSIAWTGSTVESLVAKYTPVALNAFERQVSLGGFFSVDPSLLSRQEETYAADFFHIAIRQLVLGHFKYRDFHGLDHRERQLQKRKGFQGLYLNDMRHEMHHSLVALALSSDKESLDSLTPCFQRYGPGRVAALTIPSNIFAKGRLFMEESLVSTLAYPSTREIATRNDTENYLLSYRSKLALKFFESFHSYDPDDPKSFLKWTVGMTTPLMRKYAPQSAALLASI